MKRRQLDYVVLLLIIGLLFFGSWRLANRFYTNQLISQQEQTLEENGRVLSTQLDLNNLTDEKNQQTIDQFSQETEERITLLDADAKIIYDTFDHSLHDSRSNRPEIKSAIDGNSVGSAVRYSVTLKENLLYTAQPINQQNQMVGIIRIAKPTAVFEEQTQNFRRSIFFVFLLFYLVIYSIIFYLIYQRNRPIQAVLPVLKRMVEQPDKSNYVMQNSSQWQELYLTINELGEQINQTYAAYTSTEEQFTTLFHELMIGVFMIDTEGKIVMMNPTMEEMLQVAGAENHFYWDVFKDNKMIQLIQQTLVEKKQIYEEITLQEPSQLSLEVRMRYLENLVNGDQIMATVYDLTHVRNLEKIQRDFVGNVSHELKTPVTSLIGFTETLLDGAKEDPELTTQFLEIIEKDAKRLQHLITDIIELSKDSTHLSDQWQTIDLDLFLQQQVDLYNHLLKQKNISVSIDKKGPALFQTQLTFFQPIVKNLLENAIQYSSQDSQITISYDNTNDPLILKIQDQGVGISQADQERIFERFYRVDKDRSRHSGGTGLGLAIVKEYSEILGGTVSIDSHPQLGSTFIVTLPKH